jgi:hypothetical protein
MPSFSRCVLGVLAGMLLALPGSAMAADSNTCAPATIDGTFAGQKLRLAVDQPTGQVRVCFRVGAIAGGAITITGPGGSAPLPTTDANAAACRTPGNTAPGPHPLADGTIQGVPVYLETYQTANQFWVCASAGTQHERLIFTTPGGTAPSVTYEQDPDIVFPPPVPDRCQVAPETCQPPPTASGVTASCTFDGVATIDPDIPPIPVTGGGGTYSFSGGADCQYSDDTGPGAGTNYQTGASISSTGEFQNDICSTGWAFSNWGMPIDDADRVGTTTVNFVNANATDITSVRYMIRFDGGIGKLKMQEINGDLSSNGAGVVQILPSPGSSCTAPPGVSSFDVLGDFFVTY